VCPPHRRLLESGGAGSRRPGRRRTDPRGECPIRKHDTPRPRVRRYIRAPSPGAAVPLAHGNEGAACPRLAGLQHSRRAALPAIRSRTPAPVYLLDRSGKPRVLFSASAARARHRARSARACSRRRPASVTAHGNRRCHVRLDLRPCQTPCCRSETSSIKPRYHSPPHGVSHRCGGRLSKTGSVPITATDCTTVPLT